MTFIVHQVFRSVADSYDAMNDVMSCKIHRLWKDELMKTLDPSPHTRLLDVAGGTGSLLNNQNCEIFLFFIYSNLFILYTKLIPFCIHLNLLLFFQFNHY